mmetsp:Transcript_53180/g.86113  ORF Transcript_53180/g.86113 Transcript_53180/m.86113 type:complete len:83 (+) Transcript_53180:362-610(+)
MCHVARAHCCTYALLCLCHTYERIIAHMVAFVSVCVFACVYAHQCMDTAYLHTLSLPLSVPLMHTYTLSISYTHTDIHIAKK